MKGGNYSKAMKYYLYDSLGNLMKVLPDYRQASTYKLAFGNRYWSIKQSNNDNRRTYYGSPKESEGTWKS